MCLSNVLGSKARGKYIDKMDVRVDGYVWLWRCYNVKPGKQGYLRGQYWLDPVYEGKNTCVDRYASHSYKSGFHCWTTRKDASLWNRGESKDAIIVPVKVRKSWITAVGKQQGNFVDATAVVCKHIII